MRVRMGGPSFSGSSEERKSGNQKRRKSSPMGVPGPVLVKYAFSSGLSRGGLFAPLQNSVGRATRSAHARSASLYRSVVGYARTFLGATPQRGEGNTYVHSQRCV